MNLGVLRTFFLLFTLLWWITSIFGVIWFISSTFYAYEEYEVTLILTHVKSVIQVSRHLWYGHVKTWSQLQKCLVYECNYRVGKVVMLCLLYFAVYHKLIYYDVTDWLLTDYLSTTPLCTMYLTALEVTARRIQGLFIIPKSKTLGKYLFLPPCS